MTASPQPARPLTIGVVDERFFLTSTARDQFGSVGTVELVSGAADLARCQVLGVHHTRPLSAADLRAAERCLLVVHPGSALLCDVAVASELGIAVVHFPGRNARSVGEHAVALLLDLAKGITASDRSARRGEPWQAGDRSLCGTELHGKVLGLVGFGEVATAVAAIAGTGLGMAVRAWARRPAAVEAAGVEWVPDLDDLLAGADAVSLHLPLDDSTAGILDRRRVGLLRPHALLVNTARAGLVDAEAVAEALQQGRLGGAGFDVWPSDRADADFALLGAPRVVLTRHQAGFTHEAAERSMAAGVDAIRSVLAGHRPRLGRLADPEAWDRRRRPAPAPAVSGTRP